MTSQRKIILEEIRKLDSHPTADEIYDLVRQRMPKISLGTVYRNLDILSKTGHIKKIGADYPQMRFDGNTRSHYHIICMGCGRIRDAHVKVSERGIKRIEKAVGEATDHEIFGHTLEFSGLCPDCMKEGKTLMNESIKDCMS